MYRLIVADDERIVLNGIVNTIPWDELGVQVVATAENGKDLYEKCIRYLPDILLVDIRMPEEDGLTVIGKLKPLFPDCQFIIVTAYEDFNYAKKAIELGVLGYITKPVLRNEVMENVRSAVGKLQEIRKESRSGNEKMRTGGADSLIDRIIRYMQSHIDSDFTLMDVADYVQMNSAYLSRYFREKTGTSFIDEVKRMKVERAQYLLRSTNMKLYEISDQLGYKSVQYFSKLFKEATGATPIEYRQKRS